MKHISKKTYMSFRAHLERNSQFTGASSSFSLPVSSYARMVQLYSPLGSKKYSCCTQGPKNLLTQYLKTNTSTVQYQYIPEEKSELPSRRRKNLKSHILPIFVVFTNIYTEMTNHEYYVYLNINFI
jgi:hypothetical protein